MEQIKVATQKTMQHKLYGQSRALRTKNPSFQQAVRADKNLEKGNKSTYPIFQEENH